MQVLCKVFFAQTITIHFDNPFDLEGYGQGSCYDDVRFLDASQQNKAPCDEDAAVIGQEYCGTTAPADIVISGSQLIVEFCSDYSITKAGFKFSWTSLGTFVTTPAPPLVSTAPWTGPTQRPTTGCGVQAPGYEPIDVDDVRIVGGEHAKPHSWPWAVSIMANYGTWLTYCGGSLINSQWMVTAGHCFYGVDPSSWSSFYLKFGADDRGDINTPNEPTQQVVQIKNAIVHPNYDPYLTNHDVTLIQLASPVTFNDYVRPLCLPTDTDNLAANTNTVVVGWGTTTMDGDEPNLLQQVVVPIVDHQTCVADYKAIDGVVDDTMICAGLQTTGGKDSCQGDSGGPLMIKKSDGRWYLEGIVSWGQGCAEAGYPGVYSKVAVLTDWIQQTIAASSD